MPEAAVTRWVGAAASSAYWEGVHSRDAATLLPELEDATLKMLEALDAGSK